MKTAAMALCALLLAGCVERRESPVKTERATVVQLAYLPASDGTTVRMPEVWAVVFRCADHQRTFALRDKGVYERAEVGTEVVLEYVDVIEVRDGQEIVVDQQTKRVLFDAKP